MKNSTIVYSLLTLSLAFGILYLINDNFGKIAFVVPFIALYFADKVKKQEDQKLGNKLIIFSIVIFIIIAALQIIPLFSWAQKIPSGIQLSEIELPQGWQITRETPPLLGVSSYFLENKVENLSSIVFIWTGVKFPNEGEFKYNVSTNIDGAQCAISKKGPVIRHIENKDIVTYGTYSDCRKDLVRIEVDVFQPSEIFNEQKTRESATELTKAVLNKLQS